MLTPRSNFRGFVTDVGVRKNGDVWMPLYPEKFERLVRLFTANVITRQVP
jgi:hypothetical protein